MQLVITSRGTIRCVYSEEFDLHALGQLKIARGSHVEMSVPLADPQAAVETAPHPKLPAGSQDLTETTLDLRTALEKLERQMIERALHKAGGNRTEAAALLGLNRTTLVEKLRKYAA